MSRCTTLSGLVLKTQIPRSKIRTNQKVIEFAKTETPSTLIVAELNSGKADFYYKKSRDAIKLFDIADGYDNLLNAIKFRNDIETDVFKRYLIAFSNRLTPFKTLSKNLTVSLEEEKNANELLIADNFNLQATTKEQEQKIDKQNRRIKDLENRTEEIESDLNYTREKLEKKGKAYNLLNEMFKSLNSVHNELQLKIEEEKIARNKDIKESNKLLKIADNIIKECQAQNRSKDIEIERLSNLKWHEKLMGRK